MTTIILTIIGILLAAAAALMVIFYGGDAFNSGSTGAAANTFQNAGTNVGSAIQMYRAENGAGPTLAGPSDGERFTQFLALTGSGGSYLKEAPSLPANTTQALTAGGAQYTISGTGLTTDICQRINKNLKRGDAAGIQAGTTGKMGCNTTGNIFFVNA